MLQISQLSTFYGQSQALFDINLTVDAGQVVALLGRNGMGKTTTIHSIMGIQSAASGSIQFQGKEIGKLPSFSIAKLGLGLVPEGRQIFPNLTVRENLVATASNRLLKTNPWTIERVLNMFPALDSRISSMGNLLSGGEQQMLAIGRALMTNPNLLILDDATEGLAPLVRQDIWNALKELKHEGMSILIVDKNLNDLATFADSMTVIEKGHTVWSGDTDTFISESWVQEKYLGI
jgi:branched-chain amino acid transport system ATP-binding protein